MRAIDVNALTVGMAYLKRSAQRAAAAAAAACAHCNMQKPVARFVSNVIAHVVMPQGNTLRCLRWSPARVLHWGKHRERCFAVCVLCSIKYLLFRFVGCCVAVVAYLFCVAAGAGVVIRIDCNRLFDIVVVCSNIDCTWYYYYSNA